jgi:RNA polymerase sigma-70 factor (ECF subfamily)
MHDDSELVARVLAGDGAAFDALVGRYHATVYRQALARVGHPQDAEEVAQNVFLKAYRALPGLQQTADFGPWLRAITARESFSWLRGARRRPDPAGPDAATPDGQPTPEQAFFEGELRRAVRRAIEALPDHERRVARAYYLEGRSYREIQARFGLAHSSVAGYLYKARQRLAIRLKGFVGGFALTPGLVGWWQNGFRLLGEGDAPAQVTRASAAAASVAAVALVANLVPSPPKPPPAPAAPSAPAAARRYGRHHPPAQPARPPSFADRVLQGVAGAADLALGTRPAEAALAAPLVPDDPPAPPVLPAPPVVPAPPTPAAPPTAPVPPAPPRKEKVRIVQVEVDRVVFEENGHTRAFVLRDGKLVVEEDGKSRPATEEETARFQAAQAKIKVLKEKAKALKEKAEAFKPKEEQLRALAERARAQVEGQNAELRRAMEELRKQIEERVRLNEREIEAIRARAEELSKRVREQAEQLKKLQDKPEEREKQLQQLQAQTKQLADARAELQKAVGRVTMDLGPLLQQIGPLAAAAAKNAQVFSQGEIQQLVEQVTSQVAPIVKEAAPLGEEAARLHRELLELNDAARPRSPAPAPGGEAEQPEEAGEADPAEPAAILE